MVGWRRYCVSAKARATPSAKAQNPVSASTARQLGRHLTDAAAEISFFAEAGRLSLRYAGAAPANFSVPLRTQNSENCKGKGPARIL